MFEVLAVHKEIPQTYDVFLIFALHGKLRNVILYDWILIYTHKHSTYIYIYTHLILNSCSLPWF